MMNRCIRNILRVVLMLSASAVFSDDFAAQREQVIALGGLTAAPTMQNAEGFVSSDGQKAVFFDALDWQGKPTKVFAWIGLPENISKPVPGIVLVHGGGGTAFSEWVEQWNRRGFAAIAIAVEGQTDEKVENKHARYGFNWRRHEWAGPKRKGIYGDTNEPLTDQWIYHAVADTILANSLLRSLPEVDADQVGLMGISWGGVITSTTMGIDSRFAFAIPTYGCGDLANAVNKYGDALRDNEVYKQVWDPMLYLDRAKMPTLWFSWPEDTHFSPIRQAACYRAMPGPVMVSLIPGMRHSHPAGWNPSDSYAFAQSVVETGAPWCQVAGQASQSEPVAQMTFQSSKPLDSAVLVSTSDDGFTGTRKWLQTPADLKKKGREWVVSASLPAGTTAWFINVRSGDLTASSEFQEVTESKEEVRISQREQDYVRDNIAADTLVCEVQQIPAQELAVRGGLPNFYAKAKKGKPVTVAYFGGSITAHPGWRPQSFDGIQEMFPKSDMTMVNASVGGTGSIVGVFRADQDLLPCNPDLVFIEFAVNDGGDAVKRTKDVVRALEGIILKLRKQNPKVDICFFYTMQGKDVETVAGGHAQPAVSVHEQVASWYNLPSIYVGPAVAEQIQSGDAVFRGKVADKVSGKGADGKLVISEDNTHPVIPTGHAVYADVALRALEQICDQSRRRTSRALPVPMLGKTWEKATTISIDGNAAFSGTWEKLTAKNGPAGFRFGKKFYEWFPCLYRTDEPGASVTVRFKGTVVGLKGVEGPDSGIVEIKVDDQPETEKNYFTVYHHMVFYVGDVLPELEDGEHTITWTLSDKPVDKGKILASYYKKDNDRDFREHPEKYEPIRFSVGQILLVGDILPPTGFQ